MEVEPEDAEVPEVMPEVLPPWTWRTVEVQCIAALERQVGNLQMANQRLLLEVQRISQESQHDRKDLSCLTNFVVGIMDAHAGNNEIVWMTTAIAEAWRMVED